ncbi:MAG: thiamine-phosphate kinase [Candidatus Omnitrophica bacterium]|nr:thiamine-phosphate kinase [Candidatus Omnitrophota bacterium]
MEKISEIGEFNLINRIRKFIRYKDKNVVYGIGDDAGVLRYTKTKYLLFCSDMLIEEVHFKRENASGFQIGWKALGVNLSDIAAMAGIPKFCTVSLGVPKDLPISFLDEFYKGLNSIAKKFNVSVVGGDTNRSDKFVVDVALIGEVERENLILRSGAKIGDVLFVTETLGGSIYGKHLNFTPRIKEARVLVRNFKVNSMIDISDGLSLDLHHILEESNVGAVIYENLIPLSINCKGVNNALFEGEDFELLFSMSPKEAKRLIKERDTLFKTRVSKIGYVTQKRYGIIFIDKNGLRKKLRKAGYEHF